MRRGRGKAKRFRDAEPHLPPPPSSPLPPPPWRQQVDAGPIVRPPSVHLFSRLSAPSHPFFSSMPPFHPPKPAVFSFFSYRGLTFFFLLPHVFSTRFLFFFPLIKKINKRSPAFCPQPHPPCPSPALCRSFRRSSPCVCEIGERCCCNKLLNNVSAAWWWWGAIG